MFSIAARAVAYSEPSCCSDGLHANKGGKAGEEQEDRRNPSGMDYVRRSVLVEVGTTCFVNLKVVWSKLVIQILLALRL